MKHVVHNIITPAQNGTSYIENGHVVGSLHQPRVALAGPANVSKTDRALTRSRYCGSQVYLAGDLAKRKYEHHMSSCGIEGGEIEKDHELSCKFSLFLENKKRKPPEAGNLMHGQLQVQETSPVQFHDSQSAEQRRDQVGTADSSCRSRSRVPVTPDVCGDSDSTENHKAEESSRSSNNDSSIMFDSAAESVSKNSSRGFRSLSNLGVVHYFLDQINDGRAITLLTSGDGPSHISNFLVKNDAHDITHKEMLGMNDREEVPKLEPGPSNRLGSGSTYDGEPSSVTNTVASWLRGRNNQEWLQLGVGSFRDASASSKQSNPTTEGKPNPSFQGEGIAHERIVAKRKTTTLVDVPIAGNREADSDTFLEIVTSPRPVQWPFQNSTIPSNSEIFSDPSNKLSSETLRTVATSNRTGNAAASDTVSQFDVEETDLCLFGRSIPKCATRPEFVLAPPSDSATRDVSEKEDSSKPRKDQGEFQGGRFPARNEESSFASTGVGRSGLYDRAGPTLTSIAMSSADVQFRSARAAEIAMDHNTFQFLKDSPPSSLSALMQTSEDLRHGQAGYSWLSRPAADSVPKLIPLAKNFQGWSSSDLTADTKLAALSGHNGATDRHSVAIDQQAMRGSRPDEWLSFIRKVSPNMLIQSQYQPSEGSSVALQSTSQENAVGLHEPEENLVAWKRAIENIQNRPQWPTPEALNLASVASWCLNGNLVGVRGDSKLEIFDGERPLMSSLLSGERVPVYSSFAGDHITLSGKPPQRQSWQQTMGHMKLHTSVSKPAFQVLPPGSRGMKHAGLWFILQSAENQNGGGLPQISKAYLKIKDGKMPVSAVKKYLVTKLGLTSESEVEITCKGQPVVPSLPLQHVRDVIWFSSVNGNREQTLTSSEERDESTTTASEQRMHPPGADRSTAAGTIFSKDILMVLTYRRHPRTLPLSPYLTS